MKIKIKFSQHAKGRMALRGISKKMIEDTIIQSDRRDTGRFDRTLAFKNFPKGVVKVVYVVEKDVYFIISVIWANKK